jgi:hypothetical protein
VLEKQAFLAMARSTAHEMVPLTRLGMAQASACEAMVPARSTARETVLLRRLGMAQANAHEAMVPARSTVR